MFLVALGQYGWLFIHMATWSSFTFVFPLTAALSKSKVPLLLFHRTAPLRSFFLSQIHSVPPLMFFQTRPFMPFASSHRVAVLPLLCSIPCITGTIDWPLIKQKSFILYLLTIWSMICCYCSIARGCLGAWMHSMWSWLDGGCIVMYQNTRCHCKKKLEQFVKMSHRSPVGDKTSVCANVLVIKLLLVTLITWYNWSKHSVFIKTDGYIALSSSEESLY